MKRVPIWTFFKSTFNRLSFADFYIIKILQILAFYILNSFLYFSLKILFNFRGVNLSINSETFTYPPFQYKYYLCE
jgi:hypothetical protein